MERTDDRPTLNNMELVNRAMSVIRRPLQDYVISRMRLQYGEGWWARLVQDDDYYGHYGLPEYAPRSADAPEDAVRSYMDTLFCLKVTNNHRLIPDNVYRHARDPMIYLRDLRNNLSHCGSPDYSAAEAQDAIRQMVIVSEILGLGCEGELQHLMDCTRAPQRAPGGMPAPSEARQVVGPRPEPRTKADIPVRAPGPGDGGAGVQDEPFVSLDPRPPSSVCVRACESMYDDLSIEQATKKEVSRFTSKVVRIDRKDDHYVLRLETRIAVDDSLGFLADGREFVGMDVGFDRYNGAAKTIHMYPGPELQAFLDPMPREMFVFTDMKWLTARTADFFAGHADLARVPVPPPAYEPSPLIGGMRLSEEQRRAVTMAMTEPISYVWGVPGSGKTQSVLAASIGECVRRGERVAVIAPTNIALEQVLRGLLRAFGDSEAFREVIDPRRDILRVGTPTADFASEFPEVCESKGIQRQLREKAEQYAHACVTLLERRYESLREVVEGCERDAGTADPRDLMARMRPVLDVMMEDERNRLVADRVTVDTIAEDLGSIGRLIYGRDRSVYLEGELARLDDDALIDHIGELERGMARLRSSAGSGDPGSAKVVAMTLSKFIVSYGPEGDGRRTRLDVDHVFVDEAGYCNCIQTMALFTLGAPVTMLGDHMQLPPVCEVKREHMTSAIASGQCRYDFLWDMSALYVDHMFDGTVSRLTEMYMNSEEPDFVRTARSEIRTTYRFGPNLAAALSRHVYPSGMESAAVDDLVVIPVDARIDGFPERGGKPVRENRAEAEAVSDLVLSFDPDGDYAILTPYNDQVNLLKREYGHLSDHLLTIHRSQGREWDTVVISVVDGRANPEEKPPRYTSSRRVEGRLEGLKVINTALSRAKRRLYIVCDTGHWAGIEDELLGDVIRSASGGDGTGE